MSNHTHQLRLTPSDVFFFRDGRPMEGSYSGHGAAWPMPNVLDIAIHHALHRANIENTDLSEVHSHTPKRNGKELNPERQRQFGSLQTAGPFPILNDSWYFPRPADADQSSSTRTTHLPLATTILGAASSLDSKLVPVINTQAPSKDKNENWLSFDAYHDYLTQTQQIQEQGIHEDRKKHFLHDAQIFAAEHTIGIGIDPQTGTQDGVSLYSASYLRLRPSAHLGLLARCQDKKAGDVISTVFPNSGNQTHILAGGQQRTCSVLRNTSDKLPLPTAATITGKLVRWTLLTPAIFPEIMGNADKNIPHHLGGWLPSWLQPDTFKIQLKDSNESKRQEKEGRKIWRQRINSLQPIRAKLVAATIPRAIPITGWCFNDTDDTTGAYDAPGGARSTHLAVPAGAVYYFEADNEDQAQKLANALNWHGTSQGSEIQNRRSSLMGEKGFGLGVCSNFTYHS